MALKTLQSYSAFKVNVWHPALFNSWRKFVILKKGLIDDNFYDIKYCELSNNLWNFNNMLGSNIISTFEFSDMSSFKSTPPQKLRVKAGHSIIFELPPVESVPTPSVTWQTEDNTLLYGTKYAVTSDNRQIILSVDSTDQKRYR